ncbi:FAD-binding oxidoreductase [Bordetella sp. FB-8]|uniref:NAD(P)/FAD-dependent oxidoreductase n=1 Tax=Bordetella sp. FB-8 TaxID=1159870 RepID=UPI00036D3424|nr:FAD-binding oxidoreductase [Bordetella sp. FB-8]
MAEQLASDVAIIGGGIMGSAAALFLRKRGLTVTLLERDLCGSRSSGINFGGVRRQGRGLAQLPLAQRSHQLWGRLAELIGTEAEYERSGHFKIARSADDMQSLVRYAEIAGEYGLQLQLIEGREALRKYFPMGGERLVGGSLCPEDGQANPRLLSPAFARAAQAAGADVRERAPVLAVEHDGARFVVQARQPDRELKIKACMLLNCAGAWAGPFAALWGESVPLRVVPPAMGVTEPLPFFLPWSLGVEGGGIYCRQVRRGNVVFGGGRGYLQDGERARSPRSGILDQLPQLAELLPQLRTAHVIRTWSGTEAEMPDDNPVLGASAKRPGLFHAFGFSGAGFQLGPGVGDVMAELIAEGRTSTPIEAFSIQRFLQAQV